MKIIEIRSVGSPYQAATGMLLYRYTGQIMGLFFWGRPVLTWEKETERFCWDADQRTEVRF